MKTYLEPLAVAANVTQAAHTRPDHVLLTLANLFRIYTAPHLERVIRSRVTESLERRWRAADQDVFILTVFFNPYIRGRCFNRAALTMNTLINMARRTFKRFFGVDTNGDFIRGLTDYANGMAEFMDDELALEEKKIEAERDHEVGIRQGGRSAACSHGTAGHRHQTYLGAAGRI